MKKSQHPKVTTETPDINPIFSSILYIYIYIYIYVCVCVCVGDRGSKVVKVLCSKSEGRWFDSR